MTENIDEERIDKAWDEWMDVITEETMDSHDGASDSFKLGRIVEKMEETFPDFHITTEVKKNDRKE